MKKFVAPEVMVEKLNVVDVIATSTTETQPNLCPYDLGE